MPAFGQGGGTKDKDPKPNPGGNINVPSGHDYQRYRSKLALEFRNESPTATGRRVIGRAKIETSATGTRVHSAGYSPVGVRLKKADGPRRLQIQLPASFSNSLLVLRVKGAPGVIMPVPGRTFFVDVPLALRFSRATSTNEVRWVFHALIRGKVRKLELVLLLDGARGSAELLY